MNTKTEPGPSIVEARHVAARAAFARLPIFMRLAAIAWCLLMFEPAARPWTQGSYATKHDLESRQLPADVRGFYMLTEAFEGAVLAAGFQVGPRGEMLVTPRLRERRGDPVPWFVRAVESWHAEDRACLAAILARARDEERCRRPALAKTSARLARAA